uniref:F5/8 type C domain-containing protein n=1 Tax=Clytia hemisphaerica TaxID=252671 RepID=A0A7M5WZL6_9CNID
TGPTTTTTNFTHHTSTHKQRHDHSLHVNPKIPHKSAPVCEEKCNFLGKCDTVFTAGTNSFCRPGCTCPNGTVWSGKTCVQPLACPCKDDQGTIHDPDSIWTDPNNKCSECRCLNNRIQCKPKQCPILPCPTAEQRLYDGDCCTSCEEITTAPPSITTTKESTTEASTTQSQTTEASTTESQTTTEEALTTPSQSTESQTTQPQTTAESSTTPSQSTESPTTPSQTTESPTTQSQTTAESSTTPSQSTESPTTPSQTTESPTTPSQTTKASTTQSQSTIEASTTESQTTEQSTTVSPTKAPICDCKNPLPVGVSNKMIPDSQMKTNSIRSPEPGPANTGPAQARLNNRQSFKGSGAWEPKDKEAHLDIIFNKMEDVREIRTQGSPRDERFARRYFVFYSLDGENFENEPLQSDDGYYIFEGNNDNNGIKVNKLNIKAKAIRIVPANDESIGEPKVAMRVELYVCPPCSTTPAPPVTTTQSTTTVRKSTNIYTEPTQSTEPQVKETTTQQSTTEAVTTKSQSTAEASTTPSQSTESPTTQSQTTAEASTTQASTTQSKSTTEASTTKLQSTTEASTTQSKSTTEASTTKSQSTTEASTTKSQSTTEASTTQSKSTIELSTTESQTTEQSTTVSPTTAPICDCKNLLPVGVSNKRIPDSQMKTNSIRSPEPGPTNTGPAQGRLNNVQSIHGSGAWEPKDKEAHLDIIFNKMEDVREIRTQGSPRDERFARRYFVFYSLDGENFELEPLQSPEGSYIFEGNNDNNGIKVNKLNIKAKAIRIVPANDESIGEPQVAMRVELYVCPPCSTTPAPPVTTTQSTTTVRISTNIYTEPPLTTEPQVKETTTEQSTTESSTTESQTTESSTTESPTTKSSTTQSQTTPEASTIPSQSTTEASTTEAATTQSQTTPETSTTQSTIPTTVTTPIVTTSPQCPSMQVYSTNCTSEYHCDSREMCQPVQYAGCCCPNGGYKIGDMCVPQKNECPCVNNGIVKAPGETWKPNDHEFCRCNGDTQECVPTCPESLKCKPYEKKIFTGPSEDGECCKCVPSCQYCKIGSHKYVPIGEKWSISRDENSCVEGQCLLDEDGECAILEKDQIICEKPCPKDMKRSTNGTCCDCEPTTQVSTTPSTTEASTTIESSTTKSQSTTESSTTQSQSTTEAATTPSQTTESSTTPSQTTGSSTTQSQTTTKLSTTQSQTTTKSSTTQSQTTTESPTTKSSTTRSQTTESSTTQSQSTTESPTTKSSTTQSQTTEAATTPLQTTESSTTQSQTTEASTTKSSTVESKSTTESSTTESPTTPSQTTKSLTTSSQTTESQTTESSTTKSSTMLPTTPTCDCKNLLPVGVSDGRIPDSQMKSNSVRVTSPGPFNTGPAQARLNNKLTSSGSGAWEPKDKEAHLDIIFNKMEDVREIRTQGSPRINRFAKRFFVFYSLDGENFEQEPLPSADGSPVFEGNTNNNGIKVNKLNIKAKAIRIVPGNDESIGEPLVAMRVEFYVCPPCSTTPAPPVTTRQSSTTQSQTTEESSTTPSQTTTESSTTQSQTTSEGSTTPSKTTTESQSTTESPTEGSTTPKPKECTVKETKIKIKHQECISKEEITVASCSGSCQSSATFSAEPPFFSQDCTCCKPTEFIDVQVPMTCMRTRPTSMIIKKIAKCICSRCDSEAVIPTQHPTQGDAINPDDISNEPVVSKARRKRSITERLYDMVFGQ